MLTRGRRSVLTGACLAVALSVAGCAGATPAEQAGPPRPGGTVVVGAGQDIRTLQPSLMIDEPSFFVAGQVFDTLFRSGPDGRTVLPELATRIAFAPDSRTATITVRRGVRFQDDSVLAADDVAFSLRELVASPALGSIYDAVESVTARDPDTVVVRLKRPETDLAALLATPAASIVPDRYGGRPAAQFASAPIGTGPFRVVSRNPGVDIDLAKNPHYWKPDRPHLDALSYRVYPDVNALSTAYQAGEVDVVQLAPVTALTIFGDAPVTFARPSSQTQTLTVNGRSGPLADVAVRKAISLGINRAALVQGLLGGHGSPARGQLPPAVVPAGTAVDDRPFRYDPEAARTLLAGSSAHGGVALTLTFSTGDASLADLAQAVQRDLSQIGVTVELRPLDPAAALSAIVGGQTQLALAAPSASVPTASGALGYFVQSKGFGGGWDTRPAAAQLAAYTAATDDRQRTAAVAGFESYVGTVLPSIPLYHQEPAFVVGPQVGGFGVNSVLIYSASEMWTSP